MTDYAKNSEAAQGQGEAPQLSGVKSGPNSSSAGTELHSSLTAGENLHSSDAQKGSYSSDTKKGSHSSPDVGSKSYGALAGEGVTSSASGLQVLVEDLSTEPEYDSPVGAPVPLANPETTSPIYAKPNKQKPAGEPPSRCASFPRFIL